MASAMKTPYSLSFRNKLARRSDLFQRRNLAGLFDKFKQDVGEFRQLELQPSVRDQLLIRRTGLDHVKSAAEPENHLKLFSARCLVIAGEALRRRCIQRCRPAHKGGLCFIERYRGPVD